MTSSSPVEDQTAVLPCEICGKDATMIETLMGFTIRCSDILCDAPNVWAVKPALAVRVWNRRSSPVSAPVDTDELRDALCEAGYALHEALGMVNQRMFCLKDCPHAKCEDDPCECGNEADRGRVKAAYLAVLAALRKSPPAPSSGEAPPTSLAQQLERESGGNIEPDRILDLIRNSPTAAAIYNVMLHEHERSRSSGDEPVVTDTAKQDAAILDKLEEITGFPRTALVDEWFAVSADADRAKVPEADEPPTFNLHWKIPRADLATMTYADVDEGFREMRRLLNLERESERQLARRADSETTPRLTLSPNARPCCQWVGTPNCDCSVRDSETTEPQA